MKFLRRNFLGGLVAGLGALATGNLSLGCAASRSAAKKPSALQPIINTPVSGKPRWWKGNLHTHSYWSDGNDFPEMIADWYKRHGYHFLSLSDHDVLSIGKHAIGLPGEDLVKQKALEKYRARFGSWVEADTPGYEAAIRIKPLSEFRSLLEEPDRFIMIQNEEITDYWGGSPVHMNVQNIGELIKPEGGNSALEVMQRNINYYLKQREKTGQYMTITLNHPTYGWPVTAEDLVAIEHLRFYEVYNGYPESLVYYAGDEVHASAERMWDIALTLRLANTDKGLLYAVAVDDAHSYHYKMPPEGHAPDVGMRDSTLECTPGRGWVHVRASFLTPESILRAMDAGEFYASSGVELQDYSFDGQHISIQIKPKGNDTYTTQFIGTRRGFDPNSRPTVDKNGNSPRYPVTRQYSKDIGQVLAEVPGLAPTYFCNGDEIYVRAKVISNKVKDNPGFNGETEACWIQPIIPYK